MAYKKLLHNYYHLTKPGIIRGNLMTAAATYLFASGWRFDWPFVALLTGTACVIAAGCVFNNYIDRGIDRHMARTKKRALVTGEITGPQALTFATILAVIGFGTLLVGTNLLTVAAGLVGFLDYVVVYGLFKRLGPIGTLVGSVSGAIPPLAGYLAATNSFDLGAILVFLVLTFWQMPHFYAIAMRRIKDYNAASIPVLPAKRGMQTTKARIMAYIVAFIIASQLLTVFGYTGYSYSVLVGLIGLYWLFRGVKDYNTANDEQWAKKMFFVSLTVLLVWSAALAFNQFLP